MSRGSSDNQQRHGVTTIPPWEEGCIEGSQPRRDSPLASSPPPPPSKEATFDHDSHQHADIKVQYAERCARFFAPPEDAITPIQVDTPLTAPPLRKLSDDPPVIPPAPRSQPHPPKFVKPLTPIMDTSSIPSTTTTSSFEASPQTPGPVVALPGTMSSRRERSRNRPRPQPKKRIVQKKQPLVSRWKSKVKDMFSHDSPDESQLERIQDRHWADEDF